MAAISSSFKGLCIDLRSFAPQPLPEVARPTFMKTISKELYQIIHKGSFPCEEAQPLLERVSKLKNSIFTEQQRNLLLRALDLASDRLQKKNHPFDYLDLQCTSSKQDLSIERYASLLTGASQEVTTNAFSFISEPLNAVIKNQNLLRQETLVTLPRRTSHFFVNELREAPFERIDIDKTSSQGAFSTIQFFKLGEKSFVLKAQQSPIDDSPEEVSRINKQRDLLAKEACIYMALVAAGAQHVLELQAYSNKGLCLEAGKHDLFDFLKGEDEDAPIPFISPANMRTLFYNMARGIADFHKLGLSHQDFKPENIIVMMNSFPKVKLSDFGFSSRDGTTSLFFDGTPEYETPLRLSLFDRLDPEKPPLPIGCNKDCWSLGIVMFETLTGFQPFYNEADEQKIERDLKRVVSLIDIGRTPISFNEYTTAILKFAKEIQAASLADRKKLFGRYSGLLCVTNRVKKILDRKCTHTELYSNMDVEEERLLKERDPDHYLQDIILECLDGNDLTRPTI